VKTATKINLLVLIICILKTYKTTYRLALKLELKRFSEMKK